MARQQRNDVDYFPHPVRHGKKMFYIRKTYGNDGYVVWNMLLEFLGAADFHYLDLQNDLQRMYMVAQMDVEEEKIMSIIEDLVRMGEFDAELWQDRILYNQEFVDSVTDAYKKRKNQIVNREELLQILSQKGRIKAPVSSEKGPIGDPKGPGNTQRKEEYSKEEETKEKKKDPAYVLFYREEWKKSTKHPLGHKYQHIVKYLMNQDKNIIDEPGLHILKLKKQLSFEDFCKLHEYVSKRATSIKEMLDSWLNTPRYSKDRVSVYAVLQTWARKAPIQGTNFGEAKKPLISTKIGQYD